MLEGVNAQQEFLYIGCVLATVLVLGVVFSSLMTRLYSYTNVTMETALMQ